MVGRALPTAVPQLGSPLLALWSLADFWVLADLRMAGRAGKGGTCLHLHVCELVSVFQAMVSVWGWGGEVGLPCCHLNINHFISQTRLMAAGTDISHFGFPQPF